jgi:2-dehydro-3-deoxygluconokinase
MATVVTFGEVMMRLSTIGQARFVQADAFNVLYAGSEANVAAALALWDIPSAHVTCLPQDDLGNAAMMHLRQFQVNMDHTSLREGRLGLYFLEQGASVRASRIVYDRFDSAFANLDPGDFDWEKILDGAQWFHWSGITPAVSHNAAIACLEGIRTARKKGITVSGDINYRRNLWQYGKSAREIMPELIENCDVVVAGITDFDNCVGIKEKSWEETCRAAAKAYPAIRTVITTERETIDASANKLSGVLWNKQGLLRTPVFNLNPIVDRIGGGDAFMAGFIYARLNHFDDQAAISFATAASAFKHTVEGDVLIATPEEVKALVAGENVGKLLR